MRMLPLSTPQMSRSEIERLIEGMGRGEAVKLVGTRGYYLNTMGVPGKNDRGIYDDAFFILSPGTFTSFNGNTDPSVARKHVAVLEPGVWRYKPGQHGITFNRPGYPYPAFVQAGEVTVRRDQEGLDTGMFGINIHRGSTTTTSSLGCQTVPPSQWEAFYSLLRLELKRNNQTSFDYILIENK